MDVICLDDEAAEESGGTVEEQAEESDDLLPDYPVPSLRKVAHEQPVNAEPIALLKVDPNVSERKGKRKAKVSTCDALYRTRVMCGAVRASVQQFRQRRASGAKNGEKS